MARLGYRTTNWTRIENSNTRRKKTKGEFDFEIVVTDSQRRTVSRETVWVDNFQQAINIAKNKTYQVPKDHSVHCDGVDVRYY
tara:strand:- start:324 stop:572 length:249 start_codon:yes stop_codon:yes gene_type:complete